MTADLRKYLASTAVSKKRNSKYNNCKVTIGSKTFDSKKEAERYQVLKLLERAKKIEGLQLQVEFVLLPAIKFKGRTQRPVRYIADFTYWENGNYIVEDVKGVRTDVYKLKRRLMKHIHNIEIRET